MPQPAGHALPVPGRGRWLRAVSAALLLVAALLPVLPGTAATAVGGRSGGSTPGQQSMSFADHIAVIASRGQRPMPSWAGPHQAGTDILVVDGVGGHPLAVATSRASIRPPAAAAGVAASRPSTNAGVATVGGVGSRAPPRTPVDL
jgi:hypothetical protein